VSVVKEMAKYGLDPDVPNLQDISARLSLRQYIAFDRTDEAGVLLPRKHAEKIRDVLDKVPTVEKLFTKAIAAKDDNLKAAARSLDTKLHGVLQKYGPYTRRYADERMTEFLEHTLFKKGGDPQMLPFALALSQNIDPSTPHLAYRLLCGIAEMERHGADPAFRDMAVAMVLHCMRDERIDEGNPMTCMELVLTGTEHGRLCNRVLSMGNIIKTEKISYRAWQRSFGRSVAKRAPGLFISLLRRKAENDAYSTAPAGRLSFDAGGSRPPEQDQNWCRFLIAYAFNECRRPPRPASASPPSRRRSLYAP